MATPSALPQPSRMTPSSQSGTASPLPSTRLKTLSVLSETQRVPSPTPSKLRPPASPRPSLGGTGHSASGSSIATLRSTSGALTQNSSEKSLRRTVSIASFPQPPKTTARLSTASSISSSASQVPSTNRKSPDLSRPASSTRTVRAGKQSRLSSGTTSSYRNSKTPSLLNNSGEGKSIVNGSGARDSDGPFSIPSPPQSRSSSAQGSYSTSATTFEDTEEADRHGLDSEELAAGTKRHSRPKEAKGNVIVSVRVRPDTGAIDGSRTEGEWMVDGRRSLIAFKGKESYDYLYDNVFTSHDHNAKVYDASAKRLVRRVMEGYHGTVFAYGMTGTGKTFSMQGTASSPGVIPLAITDIFSYIRETPHREFLLRVSYLEIYNEKIHDLLSLSTSNGFGAPQQEEIKLREDSKRGVYASPLKEEIVQSPTQLLRVIARGDHARRTSSTQFNARSSRSHAVVQIVVESRERAPAASSSQDKRSAIVPGGVRVSTLSLIDLAGSERAAENKERRTEGAHINKSLLTLGTVIARLTENKDKSGSSTDKEGKHLPYRDSKLTRLLQPALSGNSLVSILCTIQIGSSGSAAPANTHTNETLNTLKFAARAKNNIVSHAKKAEEAFGSGNGDAGSRVLLERYRVEIQTLRGQLETQSKAQAENETKIDEKQLEKEAEARHEEQMLEMQLARTALKERIEHLNRLILSSKSTGVNSHAVSNFDRLSRISGANESGTHSLRSSASQSTLGVNSLRRTVSQLSLNSGGRLSSIRYQRSSLAQDDDDDTIGEFGDGTASVQMQVTALQADLADKNRYISTLERRLLQARRSSHSRMSMGLSQLKNGDDTDIMALLREKDMEISELRNQVDDKDRMLAALRSSARQRDIAQMTAEIPVAEQKTGNQSNASTTSSVATPPAITSTSPVDLHAASRGSEKGKEKKRKSVDEMSRMLDEMIQDRVENGHLIKSARGSMRVTNGIGGQRESSLSNVPALNSAPSSDNQVSVYEGVEDI